MREKELREHAICSKCGKKIGHTGIPMFWTADIRRHALDANALRRQAGLTMMLGGSGALAMAMGPDEELTVEMEARSITLCEECALPLMALLEECE